MDEFKFLLASALLIGSAGVEAGYFGTLETGMSNFENVRAIANEQATVSESSVYGAGHFVAYHALKNQRTAALAKMSLQHIRFESSEALSNNSIGGDLGIYHKFSGGNTLMLTVGGRSLNYEDASRDDTIGNARMSYTFNLSPRTQISSDLFYDQGREETVNGLYRGKGVNASFIWHAHRRVKLMLGGGYVRNAFERDATLKADLRSVDESMSTGWVGLSVNLTQRVYMMGSAAMRRTRPDGAEEVKGQTYSFALGTRF